MEIVKIYSPSTIFCLILSSAILIPLILHNKINGGGQFNISGNNDTGKPRRTKPKATVLKSKSIVLLLLLLFARMRFKGQAQNWIEIERTWATFFWSWSYFIIFCFCKGIFLFFQNHCMRNKEKVLKCWGKTVAFVSSSCCHSND